MCDLMKKLEQKQNSVTVEQLSLKCRYHKKEDEKFDDDSFLKEFKCLEVNIKKTVWTVGKEPDGL